MATVLMARTSKAGCKPALLSGAVSRCTPPVARPLNFIARPAGVGQTVFTMRVDDLAGGFPSLIFKYRTVVTRAKNRMMLATVVSNAAGLTTGVNL